MRGLAPFVFRARARALASFRRRCCLEGLPLWNPRFLLHVGLRTNDPPCEYTLDGVLLIVTIVLRIHFFHRLFFVHQTLYSNEARVLALLTDTSVNESMATRAYLNANAHTVMFLAPVCYFTVVAYLHVLLERSVTRMLLLHARPPSGRRDVMFSVGSR